MYLILFNQGKQNLIKKLESEKDMKKVNQVKVLSSIKRFMKGENVKKVVMSINSLDKEIVKKTYYLTNDKQIIKTYYNNKDLNDITLLQDYAVGYYKNNNQWNKVVA